MSTTISTAPGPSILQEARKLFAFLRRDFLVAWSYRLAFFSDWLNLFLQIVLFYFVGKLVDPRRLPTFHGSPATYVEFVAIGIALSAFLEVGLTRVVSAIRNEQLMGTLESLLMTPTSLITLQLGSVVYDLVYVPIRSAGFLAIASIAFSAHFSVTAAGPALAVLFLFIPLVWGLGMISSAGVITFRRGSAIVGLGGILLTATSTTFFPIGVLPGWLQSIARLNPMTIALNAIRDALLGGAGWRAALPAMLALLPMAVAALALGVGAFRLALRRERRKGTLGLY
jgi:ABC-2 type transport system permease protein